MESIAVASPPQRDHGGLPDPGVLAACALLGISEVYAVGGAQAIAVFGYGAGSCEPVDMVTGPGNVYVTAAKRLLRGLIGIDSEAGPTEVAILADDTADPAHVAADLISQAEHDPLAGAVLVTPSEALADAVLELVPAQVAATKHSDRITIALDGTQSGIVLVDDLDAGLRVVDAYAAEHLEIQTRDAHDVAMRVRNAGAIFVGPWSPVSLGDYCAGSNHVLPTGGCARHSSGLSVQSFLRGIHVDRVRRAGPRRRRRAHRCPRRRRGPAGARRRGAGPAAPMTSMDELPLRPELRGRTPYGAPQVPATHRLNTNENPYPLPPELLADLAEALQKAAVTLNRYPERDAVDLRTELAALPDPHHRSAAGGPRGVGGQRLQRGAPGDPAGVRGSGPHGAGLHAVLLDAPDHRGGHGHRLGRRAPAGGLHHRRGGRGRPGARAPTRRRLRDQPEQPHRHGGGAGDDPRDLRRHVLRRGTRGVVVVDEAYAEFARTGTPSALSLLPGRPRLIVSRTMSKAFGMAGLRLGYLAADAAVVDALQLVRLPYHLSSLTQAAARTALAHTDALLATVDAVKAERDRIVAALPALGLTSVPSDANFVLFGHFADAGKAWQALLDKGVLVRDVGLPGWLRVTAGTADEMDAFLTALSEIAPDHRTTLGD